MKIQKGDLVFYFADYDEKIELSGLITGTEKDWWVAKNCVDIGNQRIIEISSIFSIVRREEFSDCWWKFLN